MNEKSWTKPKDLDYEDGRIMRIRYLEDNTLQIELYK